MNGNDGYQHVGVLNQSIISFTHAAAASAPAPVSPQDIDAEIDHASPHKLFNNTAVQILIFTLEQSEHTTQCCV